ncbi:MAG: DUF3667 domain-containing protein [Chitinophagaceae bacterium]
MHSPSITCKACGHVFKGKYCNLCGEKVYTEHDKSILHFVEEGLHFITHFEGTLLTTLKFIATRPGKLSESYCNGIRKTLFKPLSLFFLLVVIYLLFPVFEGLNMHLYYHVHHNVYGAYAMKKATQVAQQHHWNDPQLTEAFHHTAEKVSKFLLVILIPFTALFFWAVTYKKRRYFFDQMVFATEINSVYLIWGFMVLPLLLWLFEAIHHKVTGNYLPMGDTFLGIIMYLIMELYVVVAVKRFYGVSTRKAIGIALLFYFVHNIIVQVIYKFLLFDITIRFLH